MSFSKSRWIHFFPTLSCARVSIEWCCCPAEAWRSWMNVEKYAMENIFRVKWVNEKSSKHQGIFPKDIVSLRVLWVDEWWNLNYHRSDQYSITFAYLAVLDGDFGRGRRRCLNTRCCSPPPPCAPVCVGFETTQKWMKHCFTSFNKSVTLSRK